MLYSSKVEHERDFELTPYLTLINDWCEYNWTDYVTMDFNCLTIQNVTFCP